MNPSLRDRIVRRLENLSDERAYQVLDYVEFLESRYAERQAPAPGIFQRFAEGVEDTLRAGKVSTAAVVETMSLLNKAVGVLSGVAAAGKSVATDLATAASEAAKAVTPGNPPAGAQASDSRPASPPPDTVKPTPPDAPKANSPGGGPAGT